MESRKAIIVVNLQIPWKSSHEKNEREIFAEMGVRRQRAAKVRQKYAHLLEITLI